jgi:hypothetical protein
MQIILLPLIAVALYLDPRPLFGARRYFRVAAFATPALALILGVVRDQQSHARRIYAVDGRRGWRTLRLFLLYSPRWLFFLPGVFLVGLGLVGYAIALPGLTIGHVSFDAHTLLFASLFILCGYQSMVFAVFTKTLAINEGLHPPDARLSRFYEIATIEKGVMVSALTMAVGIALLLLAINAWRLVDFGHLGYARTMRPVVPGATLVVLGVRRSCRVSLSACWASSGDEVKGKHHAR